MRQFNINRKMLSIILCIVLICTFTLSIAYAALSVTLNISGNAEVVASNWNIHLDNPRVSSGSVNTTIPTISGNTLSFSANLTTPGDYYEFTVDVVNDGTIDAMIDSIVKTPELTTSQAKYLRYEIVYQNGESVSTKQTLFKGTKMPIKVRIEYRKDISASDLPSSDTLLNLKLTLVYAQSDGRGSNVTNNGQIRPIVNGNINDIGTIVTIGTEQFYTIGTEGNNVKLFAMYNLHVGNKVSLSSGENTYDVVPLENPTGLQDVTALGQVYDLVNDVEVFPFIGTTAFSDYESNQSNYNDYTGSIVEGYVNNYKDLLESKFDINIVEARLITYDELSDPLTFACGLDTWSCADSPYEWIYSTSYWTGTAMDDDKVLSVLIQNSYFSYDWDFTYNDIFGVRPVIVVSKNTLLGIDIELISFTIEGTTYHAESGMTWTEWIESDYNVDGVYELYGVVYNKYDIPIGLDGECGMELDDVIIPSTNYTETFEQC